MKAEAIKATEEWYEALQSLPFKSSRYSILFFMTWIFGIVKPGKTLYLLKQKSKVRATGKKRKVIPLMGTIQDYHTAKNEH